MMFSCRYGRLVVSLSALLSFASLIPGTAAPRLANTSGWKQTPFDRNPWMFANWQEAGRALESPDVLQRRSGVEWLGRWTDTYTTYGVAPDKKACGLLQGQTWLVPGLTRAVHEMPDGDSLQAARLLVFVGPTAKSAIPTLCAELASPDYGDGKPGDGDDFLARADLASSLTHVCGGPENVAPVLIALMQDKEPETRRAAAAAVRFCANNTYASVGPPLEGSYIASPAQEQEWHAKFWKSLIPALGTDVDDPVTSVRLAALTSLETLTYNSADAPWQKAMPPLSRAVASPDSRLRLGAARVLAFVPADTSPAAAALRNALHSNDEAARPYIVTALSHAAWVNPAATLDAFLPDLSASSVEKRRLAAADIQRLHGGLWESGGTAGYEELLTTQGYQDNVYTGRMTGWSLEVDSNVPRSESAAFYQRWHKAGDAAKARLLAVLVQATADSDHTVRTDAAAALELIGKWDDGGLSSGCFPNPAVEYRPLVDKALAQAAEALKTAEPALAKRLIDLKTRIETPHDTA